jgi:hypothetical protein
VVSVRGRAVPDPRGPGWLGAGGLEGVGRAVVLAGLPDDRVAVVLAAVVDSDADAEGEGGLALGEVAVADAVRAVGGDAEGGIQPVEGLLGVANRGPLVVVVVGGVGVVVDPVAVVQVVGQLRVVVGPGPHLGVVGGQMSHGVTVGPVVGVKLEGLGGQLLLGYGGVAAHAGSLPAGGRGGRGLCLAAARAHPANSSSAGRVAGGGHRPHPLSFAGSPTAHRAAARGGCVRGWWAGLVGRDGPGRPGG